MAIKRAMLRNHSLTSQPVKGKKKAAAVERFAGNGEQPEICFHEEEKQGKLTEKKNELQKGKSMKMNNYILITYIFNLMLR